MSDSGGDFGATGRTDDHTNLSGFGIGDDGGRHGRQRSFARFDEVHLTGRHFKEAGDVWRREVGHLVVDDDARLLRSETGSETVFQFDFLKIFFYRNTIQCLRFKLMLK